MEGSLIMIVMRKMPVSHTLIQPIAHGQRISPNVLF